MPHGQRVRVGALLLAVLVQVAGVLVLLLERQPRRALDAEPVPIYILPLSSFTAMASLPPVEEIRLQPRQRRSTAAGTAVQPAPPPDAPRLQPEPGTDRSISPAPDWYAGAPGTAARLVEKEASAANNRLDSRPKVMELPAQPPEADRVTRLDNGDLQFRSGDIVCTYTRPPMGLQSNEWARHLPASCGYRPLPKTTFAQEFDRKLQEKKPAYLKPGPQERGAGSNAEEPQ